MVSFVVQRSHHTAGIFKMGREANPPEARQLAGLRPWRVGRHVRVRRAHASCVSARAEMKCPATPKQKREVLFVSCPCTGADKGFFVASLFSCRKQRAHAGRRKRVTASKSHAGATAGALIAVQGELTAQSWDAQLQKPGTKTSFGFSCETWPQTRSFSYQVLPSSCLESSEIPT